MSARAGVIVTGTEVLTGRVVDRNGPFVAERLRELGVELAHNVVVGDRPEDIAGALRWFADMGFDLVVTSGGLGPTEDDLTARVVAEFCGAEMALDEEVEARIWKIVEGLRDRWPGIDEGALRTATRKQAYVPAGAAVLGPVGTAPGLVVPHAGGGPTVVVLPGPPRELQPMWPMAAETEQFRAAIAGATTYRERELRFFGMPESEIAETIRRARDGGVAVDDLEITTCMRRYEIELVTRWEPEQDATYEAFEAVLRERHASTLFSEDGTSVDVQVADLLKEQGLTVAAAESCTAGMLLARMVEMEGASTYVTGGAVVYANAAKMELGVDPHLIAEHGAVSNEVAEALAVRVRERLGANLGIGITGIAGPGGGTPDKPVGTVCFGISGPGPDQVLVRRTVLPGGRMAVRDGSTTVALHLLRRVLRGEGVPKLPG